MILQLCLALALASAGASPRAAADGVAIRAARMLDVRTGHYVDKPVVIVRGDKIDKVGTEVGAERRVIDGGSRSLLPGLMDAQTHILLQGDATEAEYHEQILKEYPSHRVARAVRALSIALEHGFTGLRDLETEGAGYADVGLRDAINEKVIPGPRMQVAGPALSTTGTYRLLHFRPDWVFPVGVQTCDGPDGCRKAVREQLSYGTDWVKIYSNGGGLHLTPDGYIESPPNWTREEMAAAVSEAHARGHKIAAHATSDTGAKMAVEAGGGAIAEGNLICPQPGQIMGQKKN